MKKVVSVQRRFWYTDVIKPDVTLVRAKHLLYMPFAIAAFNIITKNKCPCELATGRTNRS